MKVAKLEGAKDGSQVIVFGGGGGVSSGMAKKAPGTLVRVRLQNTVESYSSAPVFAQVIDGGLGKSFIGGVLIGEPTLKNVAAGAGIGLAVGLVASYFIHRFVEEDRTRNVLEGPEVQFGDLGLARF